MQACRSGLQWLSSSRLAANPAVVPPGARQLGNTTLTLAVAAAPLVSFELEMELKSDRALDAQYEGLRPPLPPPADRAGSGNARAGAVPGAATGDRAHKRPSRLPLPGSALDDLLRQSGETPGRLAYVKLAPLPAREVAADPRTLRTLRLRGGCMLSYLVADGAGRSNGGGTSANRPAARPARSDANCAG